jgi:transcriptional regulator with XRE-family HTH domain
MHSKKTRAPRKQGTATSGVAAREFGQDDASSPDLPPTPRQPTARDRKVFESRVKARLKEKGTSGRKVEDKIGMARGTLSKLYSGRLGLSSRTLREIAVALDFGPDVMVRGTVFEDLLRSAPASPELDEVVQARRVVDELRGELAAKQARVEALQRDLLAARKESIAEKAGRQRDVQELQDRVQRLGIRAHAAEAALEQERNLRPELEASLHEAEEARDRYAQDLDANKQQMVSLSDALTQWRAHAHERSKRVMMLEAQLNQAARQLSQAKGETAAAAILTGLASLGIGAALGVSSTPSRTRRRY